MTAPQTAHTGSLASDVREVERGSLVDEGFRSRSRAVAGALFSLAGIGIVMSIITGEAVYPRRYTTFGSTISDLSGTEPPHSIMLQPSRTIFIVTMLIAGTLILIGDWFLAHGTDRKRLVVTMAIFGVGLVGIGIFPGNVEGWHPLFAMACFLGGSG